MGILTEIIKKEVEYEKEVGMKCDACRDTYMLDNDPMATQEFLHHEDVGGFGSIIGDGTHWSITLCSPCIASILGKYIVIHPDD